jgi:RNA polymerase sigma-70 factor (ECF subfamily)
MTPSDQELICRIRQGDADAFEVLFARYQAAVHRRLAGMVRDEGAAADLLQEVFLRVWTRADQWHGRGAVRAWLFRIATNLALNHLRALRRRPQQPLQPWRDRGDQDEESEVPGWLIDDAVLGPEVVLEQAEGQALLRRLVEELPEDKREVFRLVHDAQMEIRAVADALGIPTGTVKSRLHYATRRLAREWKEAATAWEE